MGNVRFGMSMSLDGFVADRNGDVSTLYPDLAGLRETEMLQEIMKITGAVVMGRRAYDMAQEDFTDYEFQNPIFVLTHTVHDKVAKGENGNTSLTNKVFAGQLKAWMLETGNHLIVFVLFGAILGAWQ